MGRSFDFKLRHSGPSQNNGIYSFQQAAQHPRILFVHLHPRREQIDSRLIARFLGDWQYFARGAHHRLLPVH